MAGIISKLRSVATNATASPRPPFLEGNLLNSLFEIDPTPHTTAGPGLVWKVHEARRKSDNKECSVFVLEKCMAEKMFKPTKQKKEKDLMIDCIKNTVTMLDQIRHPKMLQIVHTIEEGVSTLAFASEPVLASLHDIFAWQETHPLSENPPIPPMPTSYSPPPLVGEDKEDEPPKIKDFWFHELEIRYGLLQIIDALKYLHYNEGVVHRNISPHVILVCQRGTWKLFGLDFIEPILSDDPNYMMNVPPYSIKISKVAQPHLDYMSPEAQINGMCNMQSDMFSLGLVICAIFNQGRPLIQAGCNPMSYIKQYEHLYAQLAMVLPRIPENFQEAVVRLLTRDPVPRPTTLLLPLTKYFKCTSEPAINALQFLDIIHTKDPNQRCQFYRVTLMDSLPYIPHKLIWMHVWPSLQAEMKVGEVLSAVLIPIMWLVKESTQEEFETYLLPTLKSIYCRNLMTTPKSSMASIVFLENMHLILEKCGHTEVYSEIVPLLVTALENPACLVQVCTLQQGAALVALQNCAEYLDNDILQNCVLGKVKELLARNSCDVKVIDMILTFYEKVLHRLKQCHLVNHVIPTMLCMKITDPDLINRVVNLIRIMITENKYGLSTTVMAENLLPTLAPFTVNTALSMEQYHALMEILYDMMDNIDVHQRSLISAGGPSIPRIQSPSRGCRHLSSADHLSGEAPVFSIPNLRVQRERKASSAENMARKASAAAPAIQPTPSQSSVGTGIKKIGQWFFGSNNSTNSNNNDNNFLRVATNILPNRRLSDNTLLNPRKNAAAGPSSSSSPGGTPGSASGLPSRRHSSIGPQERRLSHVNLSPPTAQQTRGRGGSGSSLCVPPPHPVGGSMPNTATSSPYLGASNTSVASRRDSRRDSRRPSACPSTASHLSHISRVSHLSRASQSSTAARASPGIMQQIQSGVSQLFTGRT